MTDIGPAVFVVAYGTITFLSGLIIGYGIGYRRRPYRPRPVPHAVIAERLTPPAPPKEG